MTSHLIPEKRGNKLWRHNEFQKNAGISYDVTINSRKTREYSMTSQWILEKRGNILWRHNEFLKSEGPCYDVTMNYENARWIDDVTVGNFPKLLWRLGEETTDIFANQLNFSNWKFALYKTLIITQPVLKRFFSVWSRKFKWFNSGQASYWCLRFGHNKI